MKLKTLLKGLKAELRGKDVEITGLTADSRIAGPGQLFIARKGTALNGADFIPQALSAGAAAIVTDMYDPFCTVPQVIVEQPETLEAVLASRFFGAPSKELFVAGVTGTKGKTTTTYLVRHLLEGLGMKTGLSGTIEMIVGDERWPSTHATQSAILNQKLLREMLSKGCRAASLEVSSHGLKQGRVDEIDFDVGIFTNLYVDHMEYHPDMEDYAAAKRKLFTKVKRAILNGDSPWMPSMRVAKETWTFGIDGPADIRAENIYFDEQGTTFTVQGQPFRLQLMGRFNVYNALGAIGAGLHLGTPLSKIAEILASFQTAPGRLEQVRNDRGIFVFVDYAHNGDSLENVLMALREIAKKRVFCIFGIGGNRGHQRCTDTARAADKYADISIITSDNPRKEDPVQICERIRNGFADPLKPIVELNRRDAIFRAIGMAEAGDIVLIAGKGHEKVQKFAHQTIPFDDVQVAREALQSL